MSKLKEIRLTLWTVTGNSTMDEDGARQDEAVFCFSGCDQGGNLQLFASCMSMEALGLTNPDKEPSLFLCLRESTSFYLCQDLLCW